MKKVLAILAVGAMLAAVPVSANTLQISFTGLNLMYDGGTGVIYDAGGSNSTRPGNSSMADALAGMDFFDNGTQIGHFDGTDNIYADIYIPGVFGIPAAGGVAQSGFGGFGFDLFIGSTILALDTDSPFEIVWNAGNITVTGSASTNSIQGQALPFGVTLGTPVYIGFDVFATDFGTFQPPSSPSSDINGNGEYISRFTAFGTGDVRGPISTVPEPATLMLLGFGLLSGGAMTAKRRRK
jgi:hypothetical protein